MNSRAWPLVAIPRLATGAGLLALLLLGHPAAARATGTGGNTVLTLDDAIEQALRRNKSLIVSSFAPAIARANLLVSEGAFEPAIVASRFSSQVRYPDSNNPLLLDDTQTDSASVGIQGLTPLGTAYALTASTQNVRNSYSNDTNGFQTFAGFTVSQPLLKGFGLGANLARVRIAKADKRIGTWAYRQSAIDTVYSVIVAYSELQQAHDQLDAALASRAAAQVLLQANTKAFGIGNLSQSDVTTAQYYAASLEDSVLTAEREVRVRQNVLEEQIGEDVFSESSPLISIAPSEPEPVDVHPETDIKRALAFRPDYQSARQVIIKGEVGEAVARNGLLPEVDFVGGYGYNGLASTLSASRQMVDDHRNPSFSAGVAVTIPLTFASARGAYRSAHLQRQQLEAELRLLEADIAVAVANAASQFDTAKKRVVADETAYGLAKQALDAEQKKRVAGRSTTLAVVQQEQFVTSAQMSLSLAQASFREAAADYDRQLGATLDRNHINLAED